VVLVDTSAWIFKRSTDAILELVDDDSLAICPPVLQELLQGAFDAGRMNRVRRIADESSILDSPVPLARFEFAGEIYRTARARAITIRSSNDCLIAAIAMHNDVLLLHGDRDFERIAELFPLRARNLIPSASRSR